MLKLCTYFNGVKALYFIHGFRQFQLYSTSTQSSSQFINYLVENLGFSNKQALSASSKLIHCRQVRGIKNPTQLKFNFVQIANSVISYLKSIGIQQSDIATIISRYPRILLCKVDKTLEPKSETFFKLGFSKSDFADIVKANPSIYFVAANENFVPKIQSLSHILGSRKNLIRLMKKSAGFRLLCGSKSFMGNVALLEYYGIPIDLIRRAIVIAPGSFSRSPRVFEDAVIRVEKKFGIPRESPAFLSAVQLLTSVRGKTIESKIQVFKSFGWTEHEVFTLLRSVPSCLGLSEATLKEKLGFLMNELGYDSKYLASRSSFMTCSLEKRIVPRNKVLLVLKEKGLMKTKCSLYNAICVSESKFLKNFVLPFKEVHKAYENQVGIALETLGSL